MGTLYSQNKRYNNMAAVGIAGILGVSNLLSLGSAANPLIAILPFGSIIVPAVSSAGLIWIAWGIHKHEF